MGKKAAPKRGGGGKRQPKRRISHLPSPYCDYSAGFRAADDPFRSVSLEGHERHVHAFRGEKESFEMRVFEYGGRSSWREVCQVLDKKCARFPIVEMNMILSLGERIQGDFPRNCHQK